MKVPAKDSKYSINLKIFKLQNYSTAPKMCGGSDKKSPSPTNSTAPAVLTKRNSWRASWKFSAAKQQQKQQLSESTQQPECECDAELPADKSNHLDSNNDSSIAADNRSQHWADALERISTPPNVECENRPAAQQLNRELDEFMCEFYFLQNELTKKANENKYNNAPTLRTVEPSSAPLGVHFKGPLHLLHNILIHIFMYIILVCVLKFILSLMKF